MSVIMPGVAGHAEADSAQMNELLRAELEQHRSVMEATADAVREDFARAVLLMEHSLRQGGKLLFFGNGGSASDAQHIAAELVVRYTRNRRALAALALSTDTSTLTACGNDFGFEAVFERQIEALGRKGDVAIGISTSGRSPNVLRALRRAREMGLHTVGLTGAGRGELPAVCDALIAIPSSTTARIQEMHITIGHILCVALETRLGLV